MSDPTEATFLKDVARHELEVVHDAGIHRHLRFRRPGTNCMGFDVITYPGYLVYSGDMGCFVFSRIPDMLEFFRSKRGELSINPGYWAEKLQAIDRNGGHQEFSVERFRAAVLERVERADLAPGPKARLVRRLADEVFPQMHDGEFRARDALYNFDCDGNLFEDFYESNCQQHTFRFLWCCYALVWAIQKYDARSAPEARNAGTPSDAATMTTNTDGT